MNIEIQCCGIVLLMVFVLFYVRQRKLHLDTGKAFFRSLLVGLCSIFLDVLSIMAICYMDYLPIVLVELVCRLYLVSLVCLALCTLFYICVDVYSKRVQYKKVLYINGGAALVALPFILFLPIRISCNMATRQIFTYGPAVVVTYAAAVFYLVINLCLLYRKRAVISQTRQHAVLFWMVIWMSAALLQFFHNEILVVGYASALGIMVLYLKLENPEMNLDRQTGLFNQNALQQYLKQLGGRDQEFSAVVLVVEHSFYKNITQRTEEEAEMKMIRYLLSLPEAKVFKSAGDEIMLLFEGKASAEKQLDLMRQRFEHGWGNEEAVFLHLSWIYLPNSTLLKETRDLSGVVKHVRQNNKQLIDSGFVEIDGVIVDEMYKTKEMEQVIFNAMENNQIAVYYQPIYSTEEKRITSAEALARITDEAGHVIPPYDFIWVAERNGMMLRLGEMIFESVCRFIRDHDLDALGLEYIEVNLSALQCAYEPLADKYIALMKHYGVEPRHINLEITETAAMGTRSIVLGNMHKLIDFGVSFSLDDFGTGQSNLNYIVDLPVKIVKFDRNMTNSYFENGKAKYVMGAAMHMIHGMDLKIVSEGIETAEQLKIMEALNINYIQGYYFSRPIPEQEFLAYLTRNLGQISLP